MTRIFWCAAACALALGCGTAPKETAADGSDVARLLPASSSFEGWSVADGPAEYSPEALYEYLDGGAPRYLAYGFRRLAHVRYERAGIPFAGVTLDVYDMGSDLGAFGIYSGGRPPEAPPRSWGSEGYRSETVAAAWKGSVYVRAVADDDRPELIEMLERLAEAVCGRIPGGSSRPEILDSLPPEGRIPRTERYVSGDLLGFGFLPGGVLATYSVGGRPAEAFFSDLVDASGARAAMARLRAHYSRRGTIAPGSPSVGGGGFRFTDPGLGSGSVVEAGRFVAGVHGDLPHEAQERVLGRLVENLYSRQEEE